MATTAKIAQRRKAGDRQSREHAEAALPASQPLLPLRAAARVIYENSSCAASASGAGAGRGSSRRDQGQLVGDEAHEMQEDDKE